MHAHLRAVQKRELDASTKNQLADVSADGR